MTGRDEVGEWLTVNRLGAVELVRLTGEIDLANAAPIEEELRRQLSAAGAVVVDLTAVSFIDSAGVRLLDGLVGDLGDRGTPVRLVVSPAGPVRMTLRLCAFPEELVDADLQAAAAAVRG